MLYRVKEGRLDLDTFSLDYITFGRGRKPLLLIQGLNTRGIRGAGLSLAYLYRIFAKDYQVYLFDRRTEVWDGITVRDLAADVAAAMDALGIKNADILGVSQGGMIAQHLAIDRPDLVGKLVLTATLSRNNATVEEVVNRWIRMVEKNRTRHLAADMAAHLYSAGYVNRYRLLMPLLNILQKPKDPRRFIALARACLTCSTYDELQQIKCPVLVIGGKQDQIATGAASEEMAEKLGCPLILYDGLGHAVYEEAKDFNRTVYEFFMG